MDRHPEILGRISNADRGSQTATQDDIRALEAELDALLTEIGRCEEFAAADPLLHQLGEFQGSLAALCFAYRVDLPDRLRELVRVFDRPDDLATRQWAFREIKAGRFLCWDDEVAP
jgi:hypothetical protein